jgi:cyclohexa-1,5-dienecarbonyl-CoA hydratase
MAEREIVSYRLDGRVARVTLDNPPLNILDLQAIHDYSAVLGRVERDNAAVCILTSAGARAFSAGVNVADHTREKVPMMLEHFHGLIRKIRVLEGITIAAVRGLALGGGFELALACDMIVAEEGATLGVPEIWLACFPPVAAAVLPRHIAPQKAYELVLSGDPITAAEAMQMGLVNALAPKGGLEETLDKFTARFTEKSVAALRLAKRALRVSDETSFGPDLDETERLYLDDLMRTRDAEEGIKAFLERRPPKWEDR